MYDEFVSEHGHGALREIATAHGISYTTTRKRLIDAGFHVVRKRKPRAPGTGVCACGAAATAGRYKGQGDALCFRCYMRTYAADKNSKFKRTAREYLYEIKSNAVCADCGGQFPPCVFHFDHVPERGPKLFNIGARNDFGIEKLKAEIAKCDIVCANCHAIRTWITREKPWIKRGPRTS